MSSFVYIGAIDRTPDAVNHYKIMQDSRQIYEASYYYGQLYGGSVQTPENMMVVYKYPGNVVYINSTLIYPVSGTGAGTASINNVVLYSLVTVLIIMIFFALKR